MGIGEHAVAENKVFALNLSAPFIISFFSDQVATALKYADYLFCNESEAEEYGKKHELLQLLCRPPNNRDTCLLGRISHEHIEVLITMHIIMHKHTCPCPCPCAHPQMW